MKTIEELKEEIIERNMGVSSKCGLFCDYTIPLTFPDVKAIKELYKSSNEYEADIDNVFFRRYKNRFVLVDSYDEWLEEVVALLRANEYKYNELYETMLVEYNKMENYDMTETGTDTTKKTGTIDNTGNSSNGAHTDTLNTTNGAHTDTVNTTLGSVTNSSSVAMGEQNETTIHKVRPFNDSDTSYIANSDETKRNAHTDTTNETLGSQTNTSSNAYGSQTNTSSNQYGAQQNTNNNLETFDTTDATTHTFSRHGNIGVLSGQQLIEQSRKVAMFNIWSVIFADVNNHLLGGFV